VRIAIAAIVTTLLFGFVLSEHGEQEGVEWQYQVGKAMEVAGILACVTAGLIALWVWAI
jgi:hypothetical protein